MVHKKRQFVVSKKKNWFSNTPGNLFSLNLRKIDVNYGNHSELYFIRQKIIRLWDYLMLAGVRLMA